jgi:hypothetical protein
MGVPASGSGGGVTRMTVGLGRRRIEFEFQPEMPRGHVPMVDKTTPWSTPGSRPSGILREPEPTGSAYLEASAHQH